MVTRVLERRRLRGKISAAGGVGNLLSSSWTNDKARDTRTLLELPTKVTKTQDMSRPDQIAIGRAIVDRPGKDDFWVTNNTAGWTFAAATKEVPEACPTRVHVDRLRKVSRGVSRQGASCQGTFSSGGCRGRSRQVQTRGVSGLLGTRELALLESHYRLAEAECRAENSGGWASADPGGDRRYRRPAPKGKDCLTRSAPAGLEAGGLNRCEVEHSEDDFHGAPGSPGWGAGGETGEAGEKGIARVANARLRFLEPDARVTKLSRRDPAVRSHSSPPRPDSGHARRAATGVASPPKLGTSDRRSNGKRNAEDDSPRGVRGEKLTPQPLNMGRTGEPWAEGAGANGERRGGACMGGSIKLHKGLVITDELRGELLNPLAHHRFKVLRGAH